MGNKLTAFRLTKDSDPVFIEMLRFLYVQALARGFFTKPLTPPTPAEQQRWWAELDHTKITAHLYRLTDRPWEIVAFSMVTDHGDYATPIFALAPGFWGRGLGREIIAHYIAIAGKPLLGEQLVSNDPIRHLNAKAGWIVLSSDGRVEKLRHPGPPRTDFPDYHALLAGFDA